MRLRFHGIIARRHPWLPSMAPGLSCADRPWIGVLFIFERNGQRFSNFTPEQRWNVFPDSAANNVNRFG